MFVVIPRAVRLVVLFMLVQLFWACGGGGDKPDTTPNSFSFTSQTDVALDATATSNSITVTGINRDAAISVTGGEYRVNGGAFVSTSGTVSKDDTVTVRLTSASTISTSRTASLTIGGVSANFMVTTVGDIFPPTATVYFPTPNVLTEGTSLPIRGVASDEHNGIASINVVVSPDGGTTETQNITLTPTGGADLAEGWSADLTLTADAVNTVSVYATDSEGNTQVNPTVVTITQSSTAANFPEGSASIGNDTFGVVNMSFNPDGSELWVPVSNASASALMAVNLQTGARSEVYSKMELGDTGNSCNGVSYYEPLNTVVMGCEVGVLRVNLEDDSVIGMPELTPLAGSIAPSLEEHLTNIYMAHYMDDNVMWLYSSAVTSWTEINFQAGTRELVIDQFNNSGSVDVDVEARELYLPTQPGDVGVFEYESSSFDGVAASYFEGNELYLVAILFGAGERNAMSVNSDQSIYELFPKSPADESSIRFLTSNTTPGFEANPLLNSVGIINDSERRLSYIIDSNEDVPFAVILVDLESGHRVVHSRSIASGI